MSRASRLEPSRFVRSVRHQWQLLLDGGPIANAVYLRDRARRRRGILPNGLRLDFLDRVTPSPRPLAVVPLTERADLREWVATLAPLVADAVIVPVGAVPRGRDVLLLDDGELPTPGEVALMASAVTRYRIDGGEIGAITPRLEDRHGRRAVGFDWLRESQRWSDQSTAAHDHGQFAIPRYVLAAPAHGLYVAAGVIDELGLHDTIRDPDRASRIVIDGWQAGHRTLALPEIRLAVERIQVPRVTTSDVARYARRVRPDGATGSMRIIFVLPATTVSGGIRTVFEQSAELIRRGHDVEIWSLQGPPKWIESAARVRRFRDYRALGDALACEDAVKIATWWETAEVVWLASVERGLPVHYVQEFETWFYPADERMRAAVAACYRSEFMNITIADFQRDELREIGVHAVTVPSAYDERKFFVAPGLERRDDTVLAVGRSFFQKNFAMTRSAWELLHAPRPRLVLFGFEPELADAPGIEYVDRPDDALVNQLYNEATCFVQTSRHEGFGLPVLEAMAAGCPVITTDSHGNRDFCRDGDNCVIVPQDDAPALASAIDRLFRDPALRDRLAVAGRATASEHTWPNVVRRLETMFREA